MVQIGAGVLAAAFVGYALRWAAKDMRRVEAALMRVHRKLIVADSGGSVRVLQADPSTGVYRPALEKISA